ncbi:ATP-dependent DNA ligase [Roseimicrobium gellanilyticum]|uniref:ATP-dependent DNA ligase n=1 Tax=Roseimicrobium gellanilyticum TaxID=748857 RepID=A0A366H8V6_9BACT|nr:WGR domain-containing protein [Roseimicrobium gellanilyticum]RBP38199.1 ATP-dependent DNA ligase [Roseimicrobium gellanilyticum]
MESISLYYREGASDKVYEASIVPKGDGYVVTFAYGRRGSTLNAGTKTPTPLGYDEAKRTFDKLVREKTAKGYQVAAGGGSVSAAALPANAKAPTGIHCQLLNPVEEEKVQKLLSHPDWWLQEKIDGRRLLIRKEGSTITGINRLGQETALPQTMVESALTCTADFILDGEGVGDVLHVFDALSLHGGDLRHVGFAERFVRLSKFLKVSIPPHFKLVNVACQLNAKQETFTRLQREHREGAVFKHMMAPYTPGRPASGGMQLKHKFCETASFIVTKPNPKRSVSLLLFDGDRVVPAGNVTIPPNHDVPAPGTIVDCRYLYAFRESGSIYQPVYLGPREDIRAEECTTAQLKYQPEAVAL